MTTTTIGDGTVTTPAGFMAAGIACGLKRTGAPDLALIFSPRPCVAAAAFTSNLFAAAPVIYDREIIAGGNPVHAVAINSGIANACTGQRGLEDARETARTVAQHLKIMPQQVMVSSTGRIGDFLPMDKIRDGIRSAVNELSSTGGEGAARAIMTTDTVPKHAALALDINGTRITLGAMTKGAGMIAPKLRMAPPQATMLCYLTTDAVIEPDALRQALGNAIQHSFNRITVDGDTSTNDTVLALANGAAGNDIITAGTPEAEDFQNAVMQILQKLAQDMVLDGEGVSRFVEVNVTGARNDAEAKTCAESIANSALCKTAWFGCDPNWGRVLCAAGYAGIHFDPTQVSLDYDHSPVVRNGMDAGTPEAQLTEVLRQRKWKLNLNLGDGNGSYTVWTCDLTYDYVKINADYHT